MAHGALSIALASTLAFAISSPVARADTNCPAAVEPPQSGGVYVLSTPGHLQWVKDANVSGTNAQWGSSYRMSRDIDMGSCTWDSVIGGVAPFFTGTFNGAGYLISGLAIDVNVTGGTSTDSYVGLFGRTESGSLIENVGFNGNVSATINQVVATGGVSHTLEIGALIGGSRGGTVRQSFTTGNVTGVVRTQSSAAAESLTVAATGLAGGLIGQSQSVIADSYATGAVNITVDVSSNAGNVNATKSYSFRAGGLIGNGVAGSTTRSYSTGSVDFSASISGGGSGSGSGSSAGAIGNNDAATSAGAWNTTTSRETVGIRAGTQTGGFSGLTTSEMRDTTSFGPSGLNWDIAGDCALTGVWSSCATRNDGFPTLSIFSLADRSGGSSSGVGTSLAPAPLLQQVGRLPGQECSDLDIPELNWSGVGGGGWSASWAEWAIPLTGGPVCVRELYYDPNLSRWAVRG